LRNDFNLALCDPNVRFGSKAEIATVRLNVRFTPESGHKGLA